MTTAEGVEVLLETPYARLLYDRSKGQVRLIRNREVMPADVLDAELDRLVVAVEPLPVGSLGLIVDVRAPVGRNDDAFEDAIRVLRQRFMARFRRVAVLVRTRIGQLQGERFVREDGSQARVRITDDLEAAVAFVAGE
ncbi:MAG: hypothetical protein R3A79_31025 [Nannocystaceae bacterium]